MSIRAPETAITSTAFPGVVKVLTTVLVACSIGAAFAPDASAQLARVGSARLVDAGDIILGGDAAYDPVNHAYLLVMAREGADTDGSVWGAFVDTAGNPLGPPFPIRSGDRANFARAVYSPHVSNGAGGVGGFLVSWTEPFTPGAFTQIVAYPNTIVGAAYLVSPEYNVREIAYSPTDQRFLVAWETHDAPHSAIVRPVGTDAQPAGAAIPMTSGNAGRPWVIWNSIASTAWHAARNEFGVLYAAQSGSTWTMRFARVTGAGVVLDNRHLVNLTGEPLAAAMGFSPMTGNYVAFWADATSGGITGVELAGTGTIVSIGAIPPAIVGGQNGMALSYSAGSGTFLLLGFTGPGTLVEQVQGMELNKHGAPNSSVIDVTDFPLDTNYFAPRAAGRPDAPEWLVTAGATSRYAQIVSTSTLHGGSDLRLGGCNTPDPFAALGGGTCYSGGWLPPGISIPGTTPPATAPPPPPSSGSGCSTPDPFAALGGGQCVDGGWLPPGMPIPGGGSTPPPPPPPPPPAPTGCSTPDPFVALGGGQCVDGGWLPPGMPIPGGGSTTPPPPPSAPTGCSTADPFVALGGGQCVNGGWWPPGMYVPGNGIIGPNPDPMFPPPPQSTNDCATPDPYLATPGTIGVCVNGAWQPVAGTHAIGTVFFFDGFWLLREDGTGLLYTPLNGMPSPFHVQGLAIYFEGMLRLDILHAFPAPILQVRVLVAQ